MKKNELFEDMVKFWEITDSKPQEDKGNYTVYEWRIVDKASGQVYRYVGCTRNGVKARLQNGHGYDGQYAGQIIDLFGFLNLTYKEVVTGISTKEEAEFIEKQVIAIRKPNLNRNNGGTGNVKGAQYNTGHYIEAIKNGSKQEYRTLQDAADATGNNPAQICKAIKSGRKIKGYTYRYIDKC